MRVFQYSPTTFLVEAKDTRILIDPWLEDGEYFGAWAHFPPPDPDRYASLGADYIYVSHIHPDHCSLLTLTKLDRSIPVLIHRYDGQFLKRTIEQLGFEVRELPHGVRTELHNGVAINILAADDCNPEICGRIIGCSLPHSSRGSTQIDSLCVIDDGSCVVVNTNDCQYSVARSLLPRIRAFYRRIDLLIVGYTGAGPYPQCFPDLSAEQAAIAGRRKQQAFLEQGVNYIKDLAPRLVIPAAGSYVLAGRLAGLDELRSAPELSDAVTYFAEKTSEIGSAFRLLNEGLSLDVVSGETSADYLAPSVRERRKYRDEYLSRRALDYEDDKAPGDGDIERMLTSAFNRFKAKRASWDVKSSTTILIAFGSSTRACLDMASDTLSFTDKRVVEAPLLEIGVDRRLLGRLLSGPQWAHWDNAEIGSHLTFRRSPDLYERSLYQLIHYLHD
jgi:UDP-MurNAc hydroxylase